MARLLWSKYWLRILSAIWGNRKNMISHMIDIDFMDFFFISFSDLSYFSSFSFSASADITRQRKGFVNLFKILAILIVSLFCQSQCTELKCLLQRICDFYQNKVFFFTLPTHISFYWLITQKFIPTILQKKIHLQFQNTILVLSNT